VEAGRVRRRDFIAAVGGAAIAVPFAVSAQQNVKSRRLAIFSPSEPTSLMRADSSNRYYRAFFEELQRLGHIEGRNLSIQRYGREQNTGGPVALAVDVMRNKPDLVYVVGLGAVLFKGAAVPVVTVTGNPLNQGIAESLAHPGGNITGVSIDAGTPLYEKRIELLHELAPGITKVGLLVLREQWEAGASRAIPAACDANGLPCAPQVLDSPTSERMYRDAIDAAMNNGVDGLIVADNPDAVLHSAVIIEVATAKRLPVMYFLREFVEAGGLIAYTFDLVDLNQQAARDIDAILRGDNPADIPFFQNTRFNLYINLKTAKTLGLTVPPSLLARADEVIE
jgi:putative ABC transport system substrate-binding protein